MADIAKLGIEIDSSQVKTANRELGRLEKRGKSVQNQFTGMGRSAQRLGQSMSLYLTAPIVAGGAMAVKTASEYERLQVQLEVLVGSAEKAEQVFNRLTEFAATTPFELEGITTANNMLLGFGFSAERAYEMLDTLGDIAAVSGADLKSLARITGEARAENKLLTRDLRQLINNGIPIIGLLADSLGVAESAIFDMASEGQISFQHLVDAFEKATAAGGLYENGMEKLSKTMGGLWSNFVDATDLALSKMGDTIIEVLDLKQVLRDVIAQIERATDWFNDLDESQQRMIITLTALLAAAGPVIFMLGTLSVAIGAISPVVAGVAAAVVAATALIVSNWEEIEQYFTSGGGAKMWEDLKEIVSGTIELVKSIWKIFGEDIMRITSDAFQTILAIVESTLTKVNNAVKFWAAVFNGEIKKALGIAVDDFKDSFGSIWDILKNVLSLAWSVQPVRLWGSFVKNMFSETEEEAKSLNDELKNIFGRNALTGQPWQFGPEWQFGDSIKASAEDAEEALARFEDSYNRFKESLDTSELTQRMETAFQMVDGKGALVKIPVEYDLDSDLDRVFEELDEILAQHNISVPDKMFPPGSVGELREKMQELSEEIEYMNDPERIRTHQDEIEKLQGKINELTGATRQQNDMARQLGFTFSSAFEDAIIGGNSLREVLKGLLDDIARIILRMQVIEPLANALGGALGGLGSGGGSGVPASGGGAGVTNVGDALIRPDGKIINFHPDDNILAFQGSPEKKLPGGSQSQPLNLIINNYSGEEVEKTERQGPNGREIEVTIGNAVQGMFNSGRMDKVMSANYGVRRGGVNRG